MGVCNGYARQTGVSVPEGMLNGVIDPYYYSRLRDSLHPNDPLHAVVGPLEHREFAREAVSRNPILAAPIAAGIPLWTLLKKLGMLNTRSPASTDEMFAGYEGMLSGLGDYFRPIGTVDKTAQSQKAQADAERVNNTQIMLLIQASKKLYPNDAQARYDYIQRQLDNMRDRSSELEQEQIDRMAPRGPVEI